MTFFKVARGGDKPTPVMRPGVAEVNNFLVAHVQSLQGRATKSNTPHAFFEQDAARQVVAALATGDDEAFLQAAATVGTALVVEMGKVARPADGLLLCTTIEDGVGTAYAAVLKLEIVADEGAVIREIDGIETLAAVTNVLDQPGNLQKGLVYPDERPGSSAVVGDLSSGPEARYFLRALDVVLEAKPSTTASALVKAVQTRTSGEVATTVAAALPGIADGATDEVLTELQQSIPALNQDVIADVEAALRSQDRPVNQIDTKASVRGKIKAGSLMIDGPATDIARVSWKADPQGGWTLTLHVDQEPTRHIN